MGDSVSQPYLRLMKFQSWFFESISRGKSLVLHHTSGFTSVLPTSTLYSARQATNLTYLKPGL